MKKHIKLLTIGTLLLGGLTGCNDFLDREPLDKVIPEKYFASESDLAAYTINAYPFETVTDAQGAAMSDAVNGVDIDEVMYAMDGDGNLAGYVITVTDHEGYGGDIQFSMGVTLDGTLNGISILSISETAGLGMKAGDVLVPQFENKKAEQFSYTKQGAANENEIDAISGATITTNAIVNGVNAGLLYFRDVLLTADSF